VEHALERLAKPWNQRRGMSIFRDGGNLNLSAHLWGSIQQALEQSRFCLYFASPIAARSPWVARELNYWLANRELQHLIIVLTDGALVWDEARGDFDATQSTAIPKVLHGVFAGEPFYLYMVENTGDG
jgi:hypothetical protein